jgi:hypothetical protein
MEKTVNDLILELKSVLEKNHGENFTKFYLCKFPDGKWESLVAIKEGGNRKTASYYRIINGVVEEEIVNL